MPTGVEGVMGFGLGLFCGMLLGLECVEEVREYYLRRIEELEARLKLLTDPAAVHVNILRGNLPLTKAQAIHIAGLPVDIEARLAALERQVMRNDAGNR